MNPTFSFIASPPASGAFVFAFTNFGGDGFVANAGITLVVEGVVNYTMFSYVSPAILTCPVS
jgi:hypothetical protein